MSNHPDADAFIRAILRDPADVATRLVFADWLEETGEASNVAWARYIRLNVEIDAGPADRYEIAKLNQQRSVIAPTIRATLGLPARVFATHHELLLKVLPSTQFSIWLAGFDIPRAVIELVPESVVRENLVLPLAVNGNTLIIATTDSNNDDIVQKLRFILNKYVVAVRAEGDDILAEIIRYHGDHEYEHVDSILVEFADIASPFSHTNIGALSNDADAPVVRLVNLMLTEAIHLGSTGIRILPTPEGVAVPYRVRGIWLNRDAAPARLWRGIATRIAIIANIPIEAVIEQRFTTVGLIPLRVGKTAYTLRVTVGENIDGLLVDIDRHLASSTLT